MTDTLSVTSFELGGRGRPPSAATKKARLKAEFINAIGPANINSTILESINAAVDIQILAGTVRGRVAKSGGTDADLAALIKVEALLDRALAKLPVTSISTVAAA
jgi:hypothetical protein